MRYFSDVTKTFYEDAESCEKAEAAALEAKKAAEEKKAAILAERKERATEIEQAYKAVQDATKVYNDLVNKFIKDYGSYHMTYSNVNDFANDVFNSFFKIF